MSMTKEQRAYIESTVDLIDAKRRKLEEEYKNKPQYKNSKKYKIADQHYLKILLERRNTLVNVLNFDCTGDIKYLEVLEQ